MGRITELGSLINSPFREFQARGKRELRKAIKEAGNFVAAADALGVSKRTMFRWVKRLGLVSPVFKGAPSAGRYTR